MTAPSSFLLLAFHSPSSPDPPPAPCSSSPAHQIPICNVASNSQAPFPPFKGILPIVLAWFFAPILTGLASAALFLLSRHLVLRRSNPYKRSFILLPFLAFLTFWVNIFFGALAALVSPSAGWRRCIACANQRRTTVSQQ